jgi:hypothetical protein
MEALVRVRVLAVLFMLVGLVAAPGVARGAVPSAAGSRTELHRSAYLPHGTEAECAGPMCAGSYSSRTFTLPGTKRYRATMTFSFDYRTKGKAKFFIRPVCGHRCLTVLPSRRALAPTSARTSTTVVFHVQLRGGVSYLYSPEVGAKGGDDWKIKATRVLVSIGAVAKRSGS